MREVYTSMLVAMVVLLFIFLSNLLVRFMHSAASGILSGTAVKLLLLLQIPILSAILLPASLFIGILLAYGRLYADSEMIIFSVCGMNPKRLLKTTLFFSAVTTIFVAILSLWVNPKVYRYTDHIMKGATPNNLEMIKPNRFNEISKDGRWVFYVGSVSSDQQYFYDIFAAEEAVVHNNVSKYNSAVVTAKSAYKKIDQKTGDSYIVLVDGYRYLGRPGQNDYEVIKYNEYGIQIKQEAPAWHGDESSVPTLKLIGSNKNNFEHAELAWRISFPISSLLLTLLATPLSRVQPRRGRYAKLAPAILLYIIYANLLFLTKAWIRRGLLSPIIGMWWVHGLMFVVAIVLIGRDLGWWQSLKIKIKNLIS
jgi:lipopolysaccharide export system permease protein